MAIYTDTKNVTWEQLIELISTGVSHPEDTSWAIYRYLQCHYKDAGSVIVRTLLAAYIKLRINKPSLLNSCMLSMAVKVSEQYADFRLPRFLEAWGYDSCLRTEDRHRQTGKDGRQYLALQERVYRALQAYKLHHPEEGRADCADIASMYAAAVFEKIQNGRRQCFVKLVAPNGTAFVADSHQFPCRPYEILGRVFDVLMRVSKHGNERAAEIVVSARRVEEVFASEVGFVDGIDDEHGHIHVYDSQSRHFVADKAALPVALRGSIGKGCFVSFCPIIAQGDHFKSAAVIGIMDKYKGRETFGVYTARVTYVNQRDCYLHYFIESAIPATAEGVIAKEGFASMAGVPDAMRGQIAAGQYVRLTLFLKRGKDGVKRNHVAEVF